MVPPVLLEFCASVSTMLLFLATHWLIWSGGRGKKVEDGGSGGRGKNAEDGGTDAGVKGRKNLSKVVVLGGYLFLFQ